MFGCEIRHFSGRRYFWNTNFISSWFSGCEQAAFSALPGGMAHVCTDCVRVQLAPFLKCKQNKFLCKPLVLPTCNILHRNGFMIGSNRHMQEIVSRQTFILNLRRNFFCSCYTCGQLYFQKMYFTPAGSPISLHR